MVVVTSHHTVTRSPAANPVQVKVMLAPTAPLVGLSVQAAAASAVWLKPTSAEIAAMITTSRTAKVRLMDDQARELIDGSSRFDPFHTSPHIATLFPRHRRSPRSRTSSEACGCSLIQRRA